MLASAFLEAMSVGIRVTWWLAKQLFEFGTWLTYKAFGGLYAKSQAGTWFAVILVWAFLWTGTLTIFGGYEGMASGVLVGLGWGLFTVMSVKSEWDQDLLFKQSQMPDEPSVFGPPINISGDTKPLNPVSELFQTAVDETVSAVCDEPAVKEVV